MIPKIKRVMYGSEEGTDIVVNLILYQDVLQSRRTWHKHLVREMTQIDVPPSLLKVNRAPSLRVRKAKCASQPS